MKNKILMAIDGNSLMHRAFYAIPVLTNKKGIATNAVYGFTNMLINLLDTYKPDYICVAFDRKAPTFRHKSFEGYKAKRQKMPEDLVPQFNLVKLLLKEMDIPFYEMDGFEADDILGFFSKYATENEFKSFIVTGDKDALQLINENNIVLLTKKGISEIIHFDVDKVREEYGLEPKQIIDLKGLMGDSSDNIPGVPGVGEKTALKLLHQYGTVEKVLDHAQDVPGKKLSENLLKYRDQAVMSKELATIITDIPIEVIKRDEPYKILESDGLKNMLSELEFNSIIDKLGFSIENNDKDNTYVNKKNCIEINDIIKLNTSIDEIKTSNRICVFLDDTISIATGDDLVYKVSINDNLLNEGIDYEMVLDSMRPILEDDKISIITYNAKGLILECWKHNIDIKGLEFDCFIAAYLLDPAGNKYEARQLIYDYLDVDISVVDAYDIFILFTEMKKRLINTNMLGLYERVEHPLIEVLASMEAQGFRVDKATLEQLGEEFGESINRLTNEIYSLADGPFNINSPKQMGVVLFETLNLPIIKKTKTGYSTDIEVLEQLRGKHQIIDKIIEYRQIMKLKSTYIDGLLNLINKQDGKIHSSFNQTVTATGRISSTEPNLQNIPVRIEMGRRIRKVFVPDNEEYILVDADYSQIELRVLAHVSGDSTFIDSFIKNEDIHQRTASEIFNVNINEVTPIQRSSAKAVNFGIVYGISDFGLARNLGISKKKAGEYIEKYLSRYPKVKEYMDTVIEYAREHGYVTTLLNRRRYLPELKSRNYNIRSMGERIAMNTPIQGTAADIIKIAMNNVYYELKRRKLRSKLILQVHDELIIDTYKPELAQVKEILKEKMENAMELLVPLAVDIGVGENWYDSK